jgi:alpha-L-rhamnosidase
MLAFLLNETTGAFTDGDNTTHAAIHSTLYSVARGVADGAPPQVRSALWQTLVERLDPILGIPTGPYPGSWYGDALFRNKTDHGMVGIQEFLLNNGTNSWLSQLRQGATTTMEAWTPAEKPNLTWSHPWMAFPLELIIRWLLGVTPLTPGYASVLIQPQLGPLTWVTGTVPTLKGPITLSINQTLSYMGAAAAAPDSLHHQLPSSFFLNITLPGAISATVCLPLSSCNGNLWVDSLVWMRGGRIDEDYTCIDNVTSGMHSFSCP